MLTFKPAVTKFLIFAIALAVGSCVQALTPSVAANHLWQAKINPQLSMQQPTWLGADVATSVVLPDHKILWLFGDTLIGSSYFPKRKVEAFGFIHNSVGISTCDDKFLQCSAIRKYFQQDKKNKFAPVFLPKKENEYLWPVAGQMVKDKLFISAIRVSNQSGMEALGTSFILVSNPNDNPAHWHYTVSDITPLGSHWQLFSGTVADGHYLYLIGFRSLKRRNQTIMARIPFADAADAHWQALEHWNGQWQKTKSFRSIEGLPGVSELTIVFSPRWGFVTVEIPAFTRQIHLFTSIQLTGPWHDQGTLYEIPEFVAEIQKSNPRFMFYAPKIHDFYGLSNHWLVSYNSNVSFSANGELLYQLVQDFNYQQLYIPQFLTVTLDQPGAENSKKAA